MNVWESMGSLAAGTVNKSRIVYYKSRENSYQVETLQVHVYISIVYIAKNIIKATTLTWHLFSVFWQLKVGIGD